jgi:ubiquinone/menaquinone biosynthesis C-methylase UbiE
MEPEERAKARAAATYNAAADYYDHAANAFWERFGRRTVERLDLKPGQRVLDVCCGSGASAIPAAAAVGPSGLVLGVDLAENLLALARAKAERQRLSHATFQIGDLLDLKLANASYDAVVCVFGIFFVPDMTAAVRELWRIVVPGGTLAVTTWGPRFFEPVSTAFWNAVRDVRPDLYRGFNPWDRLTDPDALCDLLASAGVDEPEAVVENGSHPLHSADDWWPAVLGSGYRGTVDALDAADREYVRRQNLAFIREAEIRAVEANVVYAVATRQP